MYISSKYINGMVIQVTGGDITESCIGYNYLIKFTTSAPIAVKRFLK